MSYCQKTDGVDACLTDLKTAMYYRGLLLIETEDLAAAEKDLTWVFEETTFQRNDALLNRAITYIYRDMPIKAIADLKEILSRLPSHIDAHGELCVAQADAYLVTGEASICRMSKKATTPSPLSIKAISISTQRSAASG